MEESSIVMTEKLCGCSALELILSKICCGGVFPKLAHGPVISSFTVNITKGTVNDGREHLIGTAAARADSFFSLMSAFVDECVHQDDVSLFDGASRLSHYEERIAAEPAFSIRFRATIKKLTSMIDIPDAERVKYVASGKRWAYIAANCFLLNDELTGDIIAFFYLLDVDDDLRQYEDMKHSASYDALTGICNRHMIEELLDRTLPNPGGGGALFIIDLDNFKSVNDIMGHPAGDKVLIETAEALRAEFRSGDIVGRLGGDEFLAYSKGLVKVDDIIRKATRLSEVGRRSVFSADGREIKLSYSVGIAICPDDGNTYERLYKCADTALYASKEAGKDTFRIYKRPVPEVQG